MPYETQDDKKNAFLASNQGAMAGYSSGGWIGAVVGRPVLV